MQSEVKFILNTCLLEIEPKYSQIALECIKTIMLNVNRITVALCLVYYILQYTMYSIF